MTANQGSKKRVKLDYVIVCKVAACLFWAVSFFRLVQRTATAYIITSDILGLGIMLYFFWLGHKARLRLNVEDAHSADVSNSIDRGEIGISLLMISYTWLLVDLLNYR
jgi:arginine exporter protein ArgO